MGENLGELVGVIFAEKENPPNEAMVPARAMDVVMEKIPIKEETPRDTVVRPKDPLPPPRCYDSLVAHVQARLPWWRRHVQPSVVRIIERGVEPNWLRLPALRNPQCHVLTPEELEMTRALINDEYMPVGAVIKLKSHTGYTVPWFLIVKDDGLGGQKVCLILNLKKVNAFLHAPKFTLESISKIYPHLLKVMWAASIDLKHAYLHLGLSPSLSTVCTLRVGGDYYLCGGAFWACTLAVCLGPGHQDISNFGTPPGIFSVLLFRRYPSAWTFPNGSEAHRGPFAEMVSGRGTIGQYSKVSFRARAEFNSLWCAIGFHKGMLLYPGAQIEVLSQGVGEIGYSRNGYLPTGGSYFGASKVTAHYNSRSSLFPLPSTGRRSTSVGPRMGHDFAGACGSLRGATLM